jgi:hypothetical protein
MTKDEVLKLTEEYTRLLEEADEQEEDGHIGAAEELREKADEIADRLKDKGFEMCDLLHVPSAYLRKHSAEKPWRLPDGIYVTPHGSMVTLSHNGGRSVVEFDWLEEDACPDCAVNPYPEDGFLTWSCETCPGGCAQLLRLEEEEDEEDENHEGVGLRGMARQRGKAVGLVQRPACLANPGNGASGSCWRARISTST